MKIGIVGAHSVGKTTLAKQLAKVWEAELINELARDCPYPINESGGYDSQEWILTHQIQKEMDHYGAMTLVCDRATIDQIAYIRELERRGNIEGEKADKLVRLASLWGKTYDVLVYIPITNLPEADGVRSVDPEFQKRIDLNVKGLLHRDPRVITVGGPREQRVRLLEEQLFDRGLLTEATAGEEQGWQAA